MITPNLDDILNAENTETKPELKGAINSDFLPPDSSFYSEAQPEQSSNPEINHSDFETPPIAEPLPPVAVEKPRLTENEYRMSAEMTVALFDGLQSLTLPMLYQARIYTEDEKKLLKIVKEKNSQSSGEVEYTEDEQKLLAKYMQVEELKNMVPFEEKERELLINPLAQIYSKYNVQIGPEFLLLTALFTISLPRVLPLFNRMENSF
jgi:hypothetical protein